MQRNIIPFIHLLNAAYSAQWLSRYTYSQPTGCLLLFLCQISRIVDKSQDKRRKGSAQEHESAHHETRTNSVSKVLYENIRAVQKPCMFGNQVLILSTMPSLIICGVRLHKENAQRKRWCQWMLYSRRSRMRANEITVVLQEENFCLLIQVDRESRTSTA